MSINYFDFKQSIIDIASNLGLKRLPNPYELESNADQFLTNGYGVIMAESEINPTTASQTRSISIVFTGKAIGNAQTPDMIDNLEIALTSNAQEVVNQLAVSNSKFRFNLSSDAGIELFGGDGGNQYASHTITLTVRFIRRDLLANC